ncbi:MAG: hypothetical protein RLZZ436_1344 [Planctomycetota bacterium]|jgi:hypothetical protein
MVFPGFTRGLCVLLWLALSVPAALAQQVDFNRDVRPILSDVCFHCHGPDEQQRKADLRLDQSEDLFADRAGLRVLVAGRPESSELYRRIVAADATEVMPPPESGRSLTTAQREVLRRWIEQGANFEGHWAFRPPVQPALPAVHRGDWPINAIDHFILHRLELSGFAPAPPALRGTWLRRVTLDLTGLPPTPAEVATFLADESAGAFEAVVDRLLASPRYGERMASRWLDAARYADTNGYQSDGHRDMWRWRDWVIDAYNANLSFDQFTIEQLAGDLLPNATLEQKIASGFNRNHRGNGEGGIIPEEYAVEYVVDRVDTVGTVWLGLTLGCARCHDHKYDPIKQREYYGLYAFFNSIPERGRAVKFGNSPPLIPAPTRSEQQQLMALERRLAETEQQFSALQAPLKAAREGWEAEFRQQVAAGTAESIQWFPTRKLALHCKLDGSSQADPVPNAASTSPLQYASGVFQQALDVTDGHFATVGDMADLGYLDQFTFSVWVFPRDTSRGTIVSRMTDQSEGDGYSFALNDGRLQVNLVKRWLDDSIRVESAEELPRDRWSHVAFSYDASRFASGVRIYINGQLCGNRVLVDELNQPFNSRDPLRIGYSAPGGSFNGLIDELRVYQDCLSEDDMRRLSISQSISEIALMSADTRTTAQQDKLDTWFLETASPEPIRSVWQALSGLRESRRNAIENFSTVMVMQELPEPRPAYVLKRGEYDKPGEAVTRHVPASLSGGRELPLKDRLEFAQWLVSADHPLTARVAVNKAWQLHFGTGLVKTVDDLGSQGEPPVHPELLDWLAMEFIRSGWDVKALHRLIVLSATYRQSSTVTAALQQADPENRLLARSPRLRLSAEMIRDQALAASGLLVERLGGPSVVPYQPAGLWKELSGTDFVQGHGEDLYRRSLYTYWKRTAAPPSMMTFDASGRELCFVRETRTNTPLQALTLLNEVTFVEAARVLAQTVLRESGLDPEQRIRLIFLRVLGRTPRPQELPVLMRALNRAEKYFAAHPEAAAKLISIGESPVEAVPSPAVLASWTTVCSLVLNLDEAVMRE